MAIFEAMRSFLPILFLLSQALASAQNGGNGPRLGLDLATQSVGGLFQNTNNLLVGPQVGWFFDIPLHPQFSIMPEIQLMTKGAVVRNQVDQIRDRVTYRYLEVPISVKISTDEKPGGLYLLAGPSLGYYIAGRAQRWVNGQLVYDQKYDLQNTDNRFQFSMLVGMGTEWRQWAFDVRAQTSLTPFSTFTNVQNVVYALTLGYRLPPKKESGPAEYED